MLRTNLVGHVLWSTVLYLLLSNQLWTMDSAIPTAMYNIQTHFATPTVVFHGSRVKKLEDGILTPHAGPERPQHPESVIFASPYIAYASMFIFQYGDWMACGSWFVDSPIYYFICKNRDRFMREDTGGAIYVLLAQPFKNSMTNVITSCEMIAYEPVQPLAQINFDHALDAMLSFGVQVFFVSADIYDAFMQARTSEEISRIYKQIDHESENYKRNINYRSLLS